MNSLILKGVLGFSSSAAVSAGVTKLAVGSSKGGREPTIVSKLMRQHYPENRLLFRGYQGKDDGSQEEWKFVWKKYFNAYSGSESDPFKVQLTNADGNAPVQFMDSCKSRFDEKVQNIEDEKFVLVLEYCTRLTSVEDLIWGTKKRPVPHVGNHVQKWIQLWKTYIEDNKGKSNGEDEWGLFVSGTPEETVSVPQTFKDKCTSEIQVKTGDRNHKSFINVLKYCSE